MLNITTKTSPKEISDYIAKLREQKGKEKEVLRVVSKANEYGLDFVTNLFWEKALIYQHMIMNEDTEGERANKRVRMQNLLKLQTVVMDAKYFIVRFGLDRWKHRLYRFMGRVSDYKKEYQNAVKYYRQSLKFAKKDPEYIEKKYPRWLEVEAFLSYSLIMSGKTSEGYKLAQKIYDEFEKDRDAVFLKRKDYATWAIWRSGIPIRTINALISKKVTFSKKEALMWISQAKGDLKPSKKVKVWADFSYRIDELTSLKSLLSVNN